VPQGPLFLPLLSPLRQLLHQTISGCLLLHSHPQEPRPPLLCLECTLLVLSLQQQTLAILECAIAGDGAQDGSHVGVANAVVLFDELVYFNGRLPVVYLAV